MILPYLIFAPLLFDSDPNRRILLGTLIQVSNSFDKVFGSLSVIADNWAGINEFRSVLVRLRQFENNIFNEVPFPNRRGRRQGFGKWNRFKMQFVANTTFGAPSETLTQSTEMNENGPAAMICDSSRV